MSKIPPLSTVVRQGVSKIGPVSTERTVAQAPLPADTPGGGENRLQVSTYFTKIPVDGEPPAVLYNGDRLWTRVRVTLETAGPVAVGQFSDLFPVLSGKGQLLTTGMPMEFDVAKGNKLYIAAQSVNRVKLTVLPYPWLETITGLATAILSALKR